MTNLMSQCTCGWLGYTDTLVLNGIPICPICNKQFSYIRCEGCGE